MWSNKYIGIPFKDRGRDYTGTDCWGLVRLIYSEQYGIDLPSFASEYVVEDSVRIKELIAQYKEGWEQVQQAKEGDIVLFRILGRDTHVGVMLNEHEFIHSREGYDVAIGSIRGTSWANRVQGFYSYSETKSKRLQELPPPLETKVLTVAIDGKTTLRDVADSLPIKSDNFVLLLNNTAIPEFYWNEIKLQANDVITYRELAKGNDALRMAAFIVIAIYAPYVAEFAFGSGQFIAAGTAGATLQGAAAGFATAAVSTAGMLLMNAIFPVSMPQQQDPGTSESQLMVEGTGNRANQYEAIPVILGKTRITPPLAAQNYVTYPEERISYLTTALAWGFGPLQITDLKIGEVNIDDYEIQDSVTLTGYNDAPTNIQKFQSLYARDVEQSNLRVTLICEGNPETEIPVAARPVWTSDSSNDQALEVTLAFHMPEGMRRIKSRGDGAGTGEDATVLIETQYKRYGDTDWTPWEIVTITGNKKDAYTITRTKTFETAALTQVRARRITGDNVDDNPDWRYAHSVVLLTVTYTNNKNPITDPKNCTVAKSVYVIQAEGQLSGQLEGINAIVQSRCRPISSVFTDYSLVTSNPAALFFHVLTHPANPQRILDSEISDKINLTQLEYWYNYCETGRTIQYYDQSNTLKTKTYKYEYNGIVANTRSILEVLRDICAAGRASPTMIDGKWTVTIDEPKSAIVQHFSPHNSWGFEGVRALPKEPDALRINFYDEEQNYQESEVIVYNTGKNVTNAELFESISLPGVTNVGAVIDHGKWHFAQAKVRREVYSLNADIEYLACNRGDRVKVTHDVPAWGLGSGRIKNIYANTLQNISVLELDDIVQLQYPTQYTIRVRSKTGQSTTSQLVTQIPFSSFTRSGNTITIQLSSLYGTVPFEDTNPITIVCDNTSINVQNKLMTINRQAKTISYTVQTSGADGTINSQGYIRLGLSEYKYVLLSETISASNTNLIDAGDLFMIGELEKESQDLIVLSIEPGANKTAKITLMDYGVSDLTNIFEDYKSLTEQLVFESQITLPPQGYINSFNIDQAPVVTAVYSDDRAIDILSPGNYRYNIKISYATVDSIPVNIKHIQCEYILNTNLDNIGTKSIYSEFVTNTITIPDVIAGEIYRYRLRYITEDNRASKWTDWTTHTVEGITTNRESANSLNIQRISKFIRVTPVLTTIPDNFKYFRIKLFKDSGTQDFWSLQNPILIKTQTTAAAYVDFNLLEFPSPRISEAGTKYRVECRLVDAAGNESINSVSNEIILYTISP
jgi:sulfur carrier protein ThiS